MESDKPGAIMGWERSNVRVRLSKETGDVGLPPERVGQ